MLVPVDSQAYIFLCTVLGGMIVGFVYDLFRVSRKTIKTNNIIVYFEDLIFWLLVSIIIFGVLFVSNAGEIRGYALMGIVLGVIIYAFILSEYVVRLLIVSIEIIKKILVTLYKIIMVPVRIITKIIYYPVVYIFNIFKKIFRLLSKISNRVVGRIKLNIKNIKISLKKF